MQSAKKENPMQDEVIILDQEAARFIRKFPKEKLSPVALSHLQLVLQELLEDLPVNQMLHPVKCKLMAALVYEMEIKYGGLEDWRNAIQFQMEVNSQMLIELPEHLKSQTCYQEINQWQHRLLKFINSLIDNNLRVYRNITAM